MQQSTHGPNRAATPVPAPTVVFDLDGTLIDSARSIGDALAVLLAGEGLPPVPLPAVTSMIGDGAARLLAAAYVHHGRPIDDAGVAVRLPHYERLLEAHAPSPADLYPQVRATVDRLRTAGCRLAVCSNKPDRATQAAIAAIGLGDRFDAVLGARPELARKPAADMLRAVVDRAGGDIATTVMVGDNANDVGTARAAGVPVIAVSYGYPRMPVADLGADRVIDRMDQLPVALAAVAPAVFGPVTAG